MHHRIGTKDLETPPAIADIRPEDLTSSDVYKRIKKFLPKGGKQPDWLGPLKTLIDARKAEEEAKRAEEAKKKEEAEKKEKTLDCTLAALGGATDGAATGGAAAVGGAATVGGDAHAAPGVAGGATGVGASASGGRYVEGQAVSYKGTKKR